MARPQLPELLDVLKRLEQRRTGTALTRATDCEESQLGRFVALSLVLIHF
jgi:hypothetical protein